MQFYEGGKQGISTVRQLSQPERAGVLEENVLVLIPHEIIPGRTICRPFRENSNLSKTTVPRKRHVSSTRRFRGKNESRHLPPWSQRRREGRSLAVLEAPRRELIRQRQRSPAAYPASTGGRRVCAVCWFRTRAPDHPWFGNAPQRVAVLLVPSAHDASCRASVAAASAFGTITRATGVASEPPGDDPGRRYRAKDPSWSTFSLYEAFVGTGAWERVVSHRFAPTDQFGVQIE